MAGLAPPRACYSTTCSGAETPVDYAHTPAGLGSPRGNPKPVVRTLSYLDLATPAPKASADASVEGGSQLPGSTGSSVLTLARTWAHDLSCKKKATTEDAAESGVSSSASSPPPACTPAKVSVVVQLELMSDKPLVLRPLSAVPEGRAEEPSTLGRATAFKRRTSVQHHVDTRHSSSTAAGRLSQTTVPAGSSAPADRGSMSAEKEKPAE